jgi:hypothetical protein
MTNLLKKQGFSSPLLRLFTQAETDAYHTIHFQEPDYAGDEATPALATPDNWSAQAIEILAEAAAYYAVPVNLKPVEENTLPSWLWKHTADGRGTIAETSAQQIFDRAVGAATYNGWKLDLFADETEARNFFDEARYALVQRFIAIEPAGLASLGLDWAYGLKKHPPSVQITTQPLLEIPNSTIDAVVSGSRNKHSRAAWQQAITPKAKTAPVNLRFTDVAADWGVSASGAQASLDIMAFRHNDGAVNIATLRHATRILTILLDLQSDEPGALSIGFHNLAPLLTALALAYDSEAARAMASAIAAIITAEAYATSAELARLRGVNATFATNHDGVLRMMRNHRRAAYGDRNDYEKISVLPAPLLVEKCPDLALVASARSRWDEALELTRQHGLRHLQVTALFSSSAMTLFTESMTQGIEPLRSLSVMRLAHDDNVQRDIHPSVQEALSRLGYSRTDSQAIIQHITGTLTLAKTPAINHAALRKLGFDSAALERLENYLPPVNDISLAFTPWVLGMDFCRKGLKINAVKLKNPRFDILKNLGFSGEQIAAVNSACYGHDTAKGAKELKPQHAAIFAKAGEVTAEAQIRMTAAVQSSVSGEVDLMLGLPKQVTAEKTEKLLLGAWRQGLKRITLAYDAAVPSPLTELNTAKRMRRSVYAQAQMPSMPIRKSGMKAGGRMVSMPRSKTKPAAGKRH